MAYFKHGAQLHQVKAIDQNSAEVDGEIVSVSLRQLDSHHYLLRQGAQQQALYVHAAGDKIQAWYQGEYYELQKQARAGSAEESDHSGRIEAPMTGKVILVNVAAGETVRKGDSLVVLESMKMETSLTAPADGTVSSVSCAPGDSVANGQLLVEIEPADTAKETAKEPGANV